MSVHVLYVCALCVGSSIFGVQWGYSSLSSGGVVMSGVACGCYLVLLFRLFVNMCMSSWVVCMVLMAISFAVIQCVGCSGSQGVSMLFGCCC